MTNFLNNADCHLVVGRGQKNTYIPFYFTFFFMRYLFIKKSPACQDPRIKHHGPGLKIFRNADP